MPARRVKKVLLCRPSHFTVEYVINPHMKPYTVESTQASRQWEDLKRTLESLSIEVEVIDQREDVPDMVFATDQAIVRDGAALLANFRYSQRKKERIYYRKWFKEHGYKVRALSNIFPFEGGDALFMGDALYVGTGFRASVASCEELSQKLNVDVIPLRLVDPFFYHLDMALLPIDHETAFYYPAAFSEHSESVLKKLVPNLLTMSRATAEAYGANSFVSGRDVVISQGVPKDFKKQLKNLGLNAHEVDISEFKKAGGGIHCLINVLEYIK